MLPAHNRPCYCHSKYQQGTRCSGRIGQAINTMAVKQVTGVQSIVSSYKALLLDQFGVLHDGQQPYPDAIEAARRLHEAGVKLFIISNSSRRSSGTISKLAKMGFKEEWFTGAITSGELAHTHLATRPDPWWAALGQRVMHLTWSSRGVIPLDQLGLTVVGEDVEQADFILAHGTEAVGTAGECTHGAAEPRTLEQLSGLLAAAAARTSRPPPPMVVANPDLVTVDGASLITMPGTLARTYASLGGPVVLMGKPAPVIYDACMQALGLPAEQVLAVGDSMEHDCAGAAAAGIDCLFVAGGIHADQLLLQPQQQQQQQHASSAAGRSIDVEGFDQLCARHGVTPQYVVDYFRW